MGGGNTCTWLMVMTIVSMQTSGTNNVLFWEQAFVWLVAYRANLEAFDPEHATDLTPISSHA